MKRMLGIDISSMLNSNYYGSGAEPLKDSETQEEYKERMISKNLLRTSTGLFTNGLSSTMRTIVTLILEWKPNYIITASDKSRKNIFRAKKYPLYKGQRKENPCLLKEQKGFIIECLKEFGIPIFDSDEYEADDIIFTVTKMLDDGETDIRLVTKDKDYLQLVDKMVNVWMPCINKQSADDIRNKLGLPPINGNCPLSIAKMVQYGPKEVLMEEGVFPEMIPDLKGLKGDKSDNIPGVRGIGKGAASMLMYYGSIEAIYKAINENEKDFINICKKDLDIRTNQAEKLKANKYNAILSKELATMVEVPFIKKMHINDFIPHYNEKKIITILKKYELNSLIANSMKLCKLNET